MIEILIAIYMQVIPGFSAFLFLLLKNKPWYYYRFLPKSLNYCGISTILYALYDYWSIAVHLAAFGLQVWVIIVFVHTVTVSLKFLRRDLTPKCWLSIRDEIRIYFQLQILNSRFNECFANSLIPFLKVTCGASYILCMTGLIKLEGVGPPVCLGTL
ncbi:hypothetical protein Fcan01_00549, partial [Folsomia candida]